MKRTIPKNLVSNTFSNEKSFKIIFIPSTRVSSSQLSLKVTKIQNKDDIWVEDQAEISEISILFFQK